jgi:hypothetical protein
MKNIFGEGRSTQSNTKNFATRSYVHTNFLEADVEENIDMKDIFKILNVPIPVEPDDVSNKEYVDTTIETTKEYIDTSIESTTDELDEITQEFDEIKNWFLRRTNEINNELTEIQNTFNQLVQQQEVIIPSTIVRNDIDNNMNNNSITNVKDIDDPTSVATKQFVEDRHSEVISQLQSEITGKLFPAIRTLINQSTNVNTILITELKTKLPLLIAQYSITTLASELSADKYINLKNRYNLSQADIVQFRAHIMREVNKN